MNNAAATIQFYGQEILVVVDEQGERWVALRPICEGIGIDWKNQWSKVTSDPKFTRGDITTHDSIGREQVMLCIPVSQLNGWLFSINVNRVKPEVRERLLTYQRECQEVLFRYFMPQGGTNAEVQGIMEMVSARFNMVNEQIASLGDQVASLRHESQDVLEMVLSDADEKEIRALIKEVKQKTGMKKLAIVGHVRKTLGTGGVYNTANPLQVKNVLRNLLGRGVFGTAASKEEAK